MFIHESGLDLQKKMIAKGRCGNWKYGYIYDENKEGNKYIWLTCDREYRYAQTALNMAEAIRHAERRNWVTDNVYLWIMNDERLYGHMRMLASSLCRRIKSLKKDRKSDEEIYLAIRKTAESFRYWIVHDTGNSWTPDGADYHHYDVAKAIMAEVDEMFLQEGVQNCI